MSKRLEILKNSLKKKTAVLNGKFDNHFADVRSTNGQPLNDKRNGAATMARWERQNDGIRSQMASIEKTERAIEREQWVIEECEAVKRELPQPIIDLLADGTLTQWRKYPNRFFVAGVDKARIIYDLKKKQLAHQYLKSVADQAQLNKFKTVYNQLYKAVNV